MSRTPIRRLASAATAPLVLAGCAAPMVVETAVEAPRGQIATRPGRPGFVVAAPHGSSDAQTGVIAAEIARRTGFGLVVASGFQVDPPTSEAPGRRYHVNRPSAGAPSRPPVEETTGDPARRVYEAYERHVRATSRGPLRFYAEIHGNSRRETANRIEVATVGVDVELARRLRTLAERVRDAHLKGQTDVPRLEVRVEPADSVVYAASGAKRAGILRLPERALHIELPRTARVDHRDVYTAIVADFVARAVTLPPGK